MGHNEKSFQLQKKKKTTPEEDNRFAGVGGGGVLEVLSLGLMRLLHWMVVKWKSKWSSCF